MIRTHRYLAIYFALAVLFSSSAYSQVAPYTQAVLTLGPTYYYQLNETSTAQGAVDLMGNATPGTFSGDYVNGAPRVGVPGPAFTGSVANASGFYPVVAVPGLGEGNLAHASNNAGHINLGPSDGYGANAMTVSMFMIGGGSAQGGDRLFTNNLSDPTRSFQINVGNNGIVVAVDPSQSGAASERTVYLPDSSGHDRTMIDPANGWYHIVASTFGDTGAERASNIRVWINGEDRTTNLMPDVTGWGIDTNLAKIGGRRVDPADSTTHSGMQDEVAIWLDRALSDAEVQVLWAAAQAEPLPACDVTGDGQCDVTDINSILQNLGSNNSNLDINGSGTVTLADRDEWLVRAGTRNVGHPYLVGDINLDGLVDFFDISEFGPKLFTTSDNWNNGEFNGDGVVDGRDFNLLNSSKNRMAAGASVVPEPASGIALLLGLACMTARRRRK
jgi:hypothetical protein